MLDKLTVGVLPWGQCSRKNRHQSSHNNKVHQQSGGLWLGTLGNCVLAWQPLSPTYLHAHRARRHVAPVITRIAAKRRAVIRFSPSILIMTMVMLDQKATAA